ncbi:hypothetical protein FH5T_19155 [Draconibacterium orientale]|nr:hypothetical protein FH5T_19155 [Draconibacterium orientale]
MRPWLPANNPDEKFASLISGIHQVEPNYSPGFEIKFERPFNNKTKYYAKFIQNESIKTINGLLDSLQEDDTPQLIKYRLNDTLNKKLKTKLKDIGNIIKEQQFELSYINPRKTTFDIDQEHKTNTFVFQLLKTTLIHIYLEIQNVLKDWVKDELIIEDFYSQLLFEPIPDKTYIQEIKTIEIEPAKIQKQPDKGDMEVSLKSFTYKDFHKNSDKLNDLCDSLKKSGFIDSTTTAANFKKIFSGREFTIPIIWTGNRSEFSYFIKLIHNNHELVVNLKQDQWKVAVNCFIKADGSKFHTSDRKQQRPSKTGDLLDKAVALLF